MLREVLTLLSKKWFGIGVCALLAGCASAWISNPSPQVRALVNDLRLEGFQCKARFSSIECMQKEPMRNKRPAKCKSKTAHSGSVCVKQPDQLIYNRYTIVQQDSGIPSLSHDLVVREDSQMLFGSKINNSDLGRAEGHVNLTEGGVER